MTEHIYKSKYMRIFMFLFILISTFNVSSHGVVSSIEDEVDPNRKINFPNTKNYFVIISDLHTHSAFSDGHVWPNLRVAEASRDGIDLLAITEHLEYQPHKSDIPHPDRNRAFDIAFEAAKKSNVLVINGSEITKCF